MTSSPRSGPARLARLAPPALGACLVLLLLARAGRGDEAPPALDPELAGLVALEPGPPVELKASWQDGAGAPYTFFLVVVGREALGGAAHTKREWTKPGKRREVLIEEWLRPAGDGRALLVAQRRVGGALCRFDPPLPLLQAPLAVGATWRWSGQLGGLAAEADFEVLPPVRGEDGAERLRVRQRTRLAAREGELASECVRAYQRGVGLVAEEGAFPVEPEPDRVRGWRVAPEAPGEARGAGGEGRPRTP